MLRHTVCHPGEQMLAAVSFCGGGILERHPRLRVAFLEGNASWVPFLMWRMDEHYEWLGDVFARDLTKEPSEYFKPSVGGNSHLGRRSPPSHYFGEAVSERQIIPPQAQT